MRKIADWGNYPVIEADVSGFDTVDQLRGSLERPGEVIPFGNGRSYGDASLQDRVLLTRRFNKFLSFNEETGERILEEYGPADAITACSAAA